MLSVYSFQILAALHATSDSDAKGATTSADAEIYFKQAVAPFAPNMEPPLLPVGGDVLPTTLDIVKARPKGEDQHEPHKEVGKRI